MQEEVYKNQKEALEKKEELFSLKKLVVLLKKEQQQGGEKRDKLALQLIELEKEKVQLQLERKEQPSEKPKKERLLEVQKLQKNIQLEKNKSLIGQVIKVLCLGKSKKDPQILSGRNEGFQVVNFKSTKNSTGKFVDVLITSCGPHSLQGEADNKF